MIYGYGYKDGIVNRIGPVVENSRTAVSVTRTVFTRAGDEQITFLSAAVAFYGFVSLIPLLTLGIIVATTIGGPTLADAVASSLDQFLTVSGQQAIRDALTHLQRRVGVTVIGFVLLVWSGLKLFRGLDVAFASIYGVRRSESISHQVFDALVVLVAIPLAIALAVVITAIVTVFGMGPYENVIAVLFLLITLTLVFFPLYYVFPDVSVSVQEVLPGAVFASVGWTVLAQVFRVYAEHVDGFAVYGLLGAALLLVTWLYFSGIIITLGAVLNVVLAGRHDEETDEASPEPPTEAPDIAEISAEVTAIRDELDEKTVSKSELESELKQYVRARIRRGKAHGWGPYLVLLYGTAMTIGAFAFLDGGWAILAMIVVWLSTLGLYTLMVLIGLSVNAISLPGRLTDRVRSWRS